MRFLALGLVFIAMFCGCLLTIDDQKFDMGDASLEAGHVRQDASDAHLTQPIDATRPDASDAHIADARHPDGALNTDGGHDGGHDAGNPLLAATCRAVADFVVTATSQSQISLSWKGAPGVTIKVDRKTYCGHDNYITLTTLAAGAASFTDTGDVEGDYNYWYEIVASEGDAGAASVLATQATVDPRNACAGDAAPQPSGVVAGDCTADGGVRSGDAG